MDTIIKCGKCGKQGKGIEVSAYATYECSHCGAINEITNISIKEWVGFNYKKFISDILRIISADEFENLVAKNEFDLQRGKLSNEQIDQLKIVLSDAIKKGFSINKLVKDINSKVQVKDLEVYDEDKKLKRIIPYKQRELMIARTETVRVTNKAVENELKKADIKQYSWIASWGERTCPICQELDGRIYQVGKGKLPPAHVKCRCTIGAITQLD